MLRKRKLQIVGEVSDGLVAVQKARELQPNLILLDIGLPTLNGIEAARHIREVSPKSIILFLSENRSPDIAGEALSIGAGYVIKSDAATELLPAVDAVLQGGHYISSSLSHHGLNFLPGQTNDHLHSKKVSTPLQPESSSRHEVTVCADDNALVEDFVAFTKISLRRGYAVVVITTESHRVDILRRLQADRLGMSFEREHIIDLDVPDMPSSFMVTVSDDIARSASDIHYSLAESLNAVTNKHLHVAVG